MDTKRSVLVIAVAVGLAGFALADNSVREAQDLIDEAEYSEAARVLRSALSHGNLGKAKLIELYSLQGITMVALGKRGRAEAAFRNLIVADPGYALPQGTSPKVRTVFEAVQKELLESGGLDKAFKPEHVPVGSVTPGKDVTLLFSVGDQHRQAKIERVRIYYRRVGTPHFASVDATKTAQGYQGIVPGFFIDADREDYAIEYYIEATDKQESRLTGVGTDTLPLQFDVLGTRPDDAVVANGGEETDNTMLVTAGIAAGAVVVVGALVVVGVVFFLNQTGEGSATVTVHKK